MIILLFLTVIVFATAVCQQRSLQDGVDIYEALHNAPKCQSGIVILHSHKKGAIIPCIEMSSACGYRYTVFAPHDYICIAGNVPIRVRS